MATATSSSLHSLAWTLPAERVVSLTISYAEWRSCCTTVQEALT
jgi:hypothetical protein